jgi:hypothetical protein
MAQTVIRPRDGSVAGPVRAAHVSRIRSAEVS